MPNFLYIFCVNILISWIFYVATRRRDFRVDYVFERDICQSRYFEMKGKKSSYLSKYERRTP